MKANPTAGVKQKQQQPHRDRYSYSYSNSNSDCQTICIAFKPKSMLHMLCQTFNYLFEKKTTTDAEQSRADTNKKANTNRVKSEKCQIEAIKYCSIKDEKQCRLGMKSGACSACSQPRVNQLTFALNCKLNAGKGGENGAYNASDALRLSCMIDD